MAVLTWFAVDCNLYTHPKLLRLASLLKLDPDTTAGKLGRLWAWAKSTENEDGCIGWMPPSEIADIMRWKKKPETLVDALVESGFLDRTGDQLSIHGWSDLNGGFASKKRADRERKQRGDSKEIPRKIHGNSEPIPRLPDHTIPSHSLLSPSSIKESRAQSAEPAPKKPRFVKPSVQEVTAYCAERGNSVDAQHFVDYYDANGWRVGKNPMKDWKAAVRNWEKNEKPRETAQTDQTAQDIAFDEQAWADEVRRILQKKREAADHGD